MQHYTIREKGEIPLVNEWESQNIFIKETFRDDIKESSSYELLISLLPYKIQKR
jgi:hypothetical protein